MKRLIFLQIVLIVVFNLPAQDTRNFLGRYEIQANCIVEGIDDYSEFHTYTIELLENNEANSNIKFFFNKHSINDFIKAMVFNDTSFNIPTQQLAGAYDSEYNFDGNGKLNNDSIFIWYSITSENVLGVLQCICKGKKTNSANIISPLESNKNMVYYDKTKQIIVIDKILQNQFITLELIDMQGKLVMKKQSMSNIDIKHLPNGVYLYRISQNGQIVFSGKILK